MATKKTAKVGKKAPATKTPMKKTPARGDGPKKAASQAGRTAAKQAEKKARKEHKVKVVRDSFTMPHSEYQQIMDIKETCLQAGMHIKKSEILRAGLKMLAALSAAQLKRTFTNLEKIKTGRPRKHP